MGAMRTHNPRITPKVHVLVHHVQNMCVEPEFNADILLSTRQRVSIDFLIFSTTNSRIIVQTPPSLENVY